ncbi:hypothetical protein [Kocuria varians]|uniref:hypothetical protein n=1 Tax=Kocuria varians TaxID=1272 RepID=UPI0021646B29|nr:hypothetical protein [Kocuria varians]
MSHRSMRLVAARAAEAGWVVIRVAWSGTSESGERPVGSNPVAVWQRDLEVAFGTARELVGPHLPVHGIGLRIGAAVLATSELPFGKRVLWEPVSGAIYMRQYTGLRRASGLSLPPEVEGGVEIGGAHFTDAEAAAIRALPDPRKLTTPGLVPVREKDRTVAKKLYGVAAIYAKATPSAIAALVARLDEPAAGAGDDDAAPRAVSPGTAADPAHETTVSGAGEAASGVVVTGGTADVSGWRPTTHARFHVAEFDVDVEEELLELGEDLLPATYTHPVGRHGTGAGAAVLAPPSADPKDGPQVCGPSRRAGWPHAGCPRCVWSATTAGTVPGWTRSRTSTRTSTRGSRTSTSARPGCAGARARPSRALGCAWAAGSWPWHRPRAR